MPAALSPPSMSVVDDAHPLLGELADVPKRRNGLLALTRRRCLSCANRIDNTTGINWVYCDRAGRKCGDRAADHRLTVANAS